MYADGGEGDNRDGCEGEGEEPPVDGGALGKALEPLVAEIPGDGSGEEESDEDKSDVAATEQ